MEIEAKHLIISDEVSNIFVSTKKMKIKESQNRFRIQLSQRNTIVLKNVFLFSSKAFYFDVTAVAYLI